MQLHCRVIGGPSVKISWEKDGERLQGNKPRLTLVENGTLQIKDIKVCVCGGEGGGGLHQVTVIYCKGHEKDIF